MELRLGVNIDHVATIRNARGGDSPSPLRAALLAEEYGADGITIHLREDRRHIRDRDVTEIKSSIKIPLNLEMAATEEMLSIAIKNKPNACCIVPEKRQEVTTEGGLDVMSAKKFLIPYIKSLKNEGIRVSLFIDADEKQVNAAHEVGADIVEFHTGKYCEESGEARENELNNIIQNVKLAYSLGIECHAGHGLNYDNVAPIAAILQIVELNIGHFLIGESVFIGLGESIKKMRKIMHEARK